MTALADIVWRLPAYGGHLLIDDELYAVTDWMRDNELFRCTAQHPVVVRDGQITYGLDTSPPTVRAAQREITEATVPLRTAPPAISLPDAPPEALAALVELFTAHEWSSAFDGSCVTCSPVEERDGWLYGHRATVALWPCPPVRDALEAVGVHVPPRPASKATPRILGDCLDPADNAHAFGATA